MKVNATSDGRYEIRAVVRALDVLSVLAQAPDSSADLNYLARETGLHSSTVFRLLETLISRDFVRARNGGGYQIGPHAFEVGSAFLRGASIWSRATELAEELAGLTHETASVGVLEGCEVLYVAIAHGQREIGIQSLPGTRHPAHCTALGKAMLAGLPWSQAADLLARTEMVRLTSNTISSLDMLHQELIHVARQGYAIDNEERSIGVRCVGVPIRDHSGSVVAAISASGPAFRMQGKAFEEVRDAVIRVGRQATRMLGGGALWRTTGT